MAATKEYRRVTVYADASLEAQLLEKFLEMGARGYTVQDCRGRGKHEVIRDPFNPTTSVRIEVIGSATLTDQMMEYLAHDYFRRRAVLATVETVHVLDKEVD